MQEPVKAAKEAARGAVREGKQAAREIGQEVRQQAAGIASELKSSADEYVHEGKARLTDQVGCIARALHRAADEMCESDQGARLGSITHSLAGRIEDSVGMIQNKEPRDVVRAVERFARREPVMFLGGCVLLGLVASRFLKASSHRGGDDREFDQWQQGRDGGDALGNYGSSRPLDEPARGPLDSSGLGMPAATPVDITFNPNDRKPDIRPDMGPGLGGGV